MFLFCFEIGLWVCDFPWEWLRILKTKQSLLLKLSGSFYITNYLELWFKQNWLFWIVSFWYAQYGHPLVIGNEKNHGGHSICSWFSYYNQNQICLQEHCFWYLKCNFMYPLHDCEMQDIMVCLTKQKSDSLIIKDLVIDSSKIQILLYQGKFLLKINTKNRQNNKTTHKPNNRNKTQQQKSTKIG